MILIADIGSTKGDWVLVNDSISYKFKTSGFNPYNQTNNDLLACINTLKNKIDLELITKLFYYGSGCNTDFHIIKLKKTLIRQFKNASVYVESDLLGACRSTCGNNSGIVSILGTGSNSCLYDGKEIIKKLIH